MDRDMFLLAERLVIAMEIISQDVKSMSTYVYDIGCSVSYLLNEKRQRECVSVKADDKCYNDASVAFVSEQEASEEREYTGQDEQVDEKSLLHLGDLEHQESLCGDNASMAIDTHENSDFLSSESKTIFTDGVKLEEQSEDDVHDELCDMQNVCGNNRNIDALWSEVQPEAHYVTEGQNEASGVHTTISKLTEHMTPTDLLETTEHISSLVQHCIQSVETASNSAVNSGIPEDNKDEIDIQENWFPWLQKSDGRSTTGAEEDKDSTTDTNRYPDVQDSMPKTQEMLSACGLKGRFLHDNSEETDRADRKLLTEVMNDGEKPPVECCRDTGSFSCSEEKVREQDEKEKEEQRESYMGAGERRYRAEKKGKASAEKSHSKQSGRQKRNRGPLHCDISEKGFGDVRAVENHKRTHTGEKLFHCALCNKTCTRKSNLASHLRLHSEERPYKCSTCEKSFKEKCNLKSHMRLHRGEKPFECSVCRKAFTQSTNLTIHMRTHTAEKPYVCKECEKAFTHSGALTCHMRLHSGEKPFICTECGKAFADNSNLHTHMRLHSGEKPFACSECGKAFAQSSTLHIHMQTHTGQHPFACKDCGSSFTRLSSLKRHKHLVHGVASSVSKGTV